MTTTTAPTTPAEQRLAEQLHVHLTDDQLAAVWPLVRDAAQVCRCNGHDRSHVRGHRDVCVHRPGGPLADYPTTSGETA